MCICLGLRHKRETIINCCQTSNICRTLVDNKIVDHSNVVGASPVGDYISILELTPGFNGPLTRYVKLRVRMRRERLSRHQLQRKPLISNPGMHHGTCVTHIPWCMSGSLTCGGRGNVPGIPGACTTRNFTYLARGPMDWAKATAWRDENLLSLGIWCTLY